MSEQEKADDLGELMYVKCAYCGKWLDVKPGHLNEVSHSLCKDCLEKQMRELDQMEEEKP